MLPSRLVLLLLASRATFLPLLSQTTHTVSIDVNTGNRGPRMRARVREHEPRPQAFPQQPEGSQRERLLFTPPPRVPQTTLFTRVPQLPPHQPLPLRSSSCLALIVSVVPDNCEAPEARSGLALAYAVQTGLYLRVGSPLHDYHERKGWRFFTFVNAVSDCSRELDP